MIISVYPKLIVIQLKTIGLDQYWSKQLEHYQYLGISVHPKLILVYDQNRKANQPTWDPFQG